MMEEITHEELGEDPQPIVKAGHSDTLLPKNKVGAGEVAQWLRALAAL